MQTVNNTNIIRVIAASMVLILHYCAQQDSLISNNIELKAANTILNSVCFIAVPIFILISGAVLLRPIQESFFEFYRKRVLRIVLPLIIWTTVYLFILFFRDHIAITNLLKMTMRGKPFFHLWYLYMLLGLYFFTPFFRILWSNLQLDNKILLSSSILGLVWLNHISNSVLGIQMENRFLFLNMFIPYIGLFFAGRLLAELSGFHKYRLFAGGIFSLSFALMAISPFCECLHCILSYTSLVNNVCAMSIVYLLYDNKLLMIEKSKFVKRMSDASFCVYLVHPLVLMCLPKHPLSFFASSSVCEKTRSNSVIDTLAW